MKNDILEFMRNGPYDKVKTQGQGLYYSEHSCVRILTDWRNKSKIKVFFDNHAPIEYGLDEIIKGNLYLFCMCKHQVIVKYEAY